MAQPALKETNTIVETPILIELMKINSQFERVNSQFDKINGQFENLSKDIKRLDEKIDKLEVKVDKLEVKVDKLSDRVDKLENKMNDSFQELRADNAKQETKIAVLNTKSSFVIGFALFVAGAIISFLKFPQLINLFK